MSLNVLRVPDGFTIDTSDGTGRPEWLPYTDQETIDMVHATIAVDLGEITEANAVQWWRRARLFEIAAAGRLVHDAEGDPLPLTLERVRRFIGLRVNVANTTDAAYRKRIDLVLRDTVNREERAALRAESMPA